LARDGFAALRDATFAEDAKSIFSSMSSLWFCGPFCVATAQEAAKAGKEW
jgi:hypothetical protein